MARQSGCSDVNKTFQTEVNYLQKGFRPSIKLELSLVDVIDTRIHFSSMRGSEHSLSRPNTQSMQTISMLLES